MAKKMNRSPDSNESSLEIDRIHAIVEDAIADRIFPGIVCGVWKDGIEVFSLVRGNTAPPGNPDFPARSMSRDTMFDLASLTKPLSTAILVMKAFESGALRLTDSTSRFLPPDAGGTSREYRIDHLLLHTSGLPAIPALQRFFPDPAGIDRDEAIGRLLDIVPERGPGEAVVYSCTGFMLLGLILERVSGMPLGELFRREIASPLGLASAGFADVERSPMARTFMDRVAPTEFCAWRGRRMAGEVHDESSFCLGGQAGNAGLFACLDDVSAIGSIYLGGSPGMLSPYSIARMTSSQTDAPGERRSLGLRLHDAGTLDGPAWPDSGFGHTGFTGTSIFMDPESRLMAVILTNRVYYGREETALKMPVFRREFHTAVMRAFGS